MTMICFSNETPEDAKNILDEIIDEKNVDLETKAREYDICIRGSAKEIESILFDTKEGRVIKNAGEMTEYKPKGLNW